MQNYTWDWGSVNEGVLNNYLQNWLTNPQLTQKNPEILMFDYTDAQTNELKGGAIDLAKLNEIKNKEGTSLLQIMRGKTAKPLLEDGKIQKQNLNYDLLIQEYIKIQNES